MGQSELLGDSFVVTRVPRWNLDQRDAYDGPPKGLLKINLVWTDPPVAHKTDEAMHKIRMIWSPHLAVGGRILFNEQGDVMGDFDHDWYNYVEKQILTFSRPGDLVVDPFCGESTTGLAAIKNDRAYYGCDINSRALDNSQIRLRGFERGAARN